jgi:hypothetical protein
VTPSCKSICFRIGWEKQPLDTWKSRLSRLPSPVTPAGHNILATVTIRGGSPPLYI